MLVSEFQVEAAFKEDGRFLYDEPADPSKFVEYGAQCGKKNGGLVRHSMVIIAMYKDKEKNKFWCLIQNFWANKYFVILSGEYLASCWARFTLFDKEYKTTLPKEVKVIDAYYAERETHMEEEEYMVHEDEW